MVSIDTERQGKCGTTIETAYAEAMYNYSLLKLGVHAGKGTHLPEHCSSNELTFKETGCRGGRVATLFQRVADALFLAGQNSESGFVRVTYGGVDAVLSVVKPEFFVGAKGRDVKIVPDILWGQMTKSGGMAAAPAVQLSPLAQATLVALKSVGLNAGNLRDLTIGPVHVANLNSDQRRVSDVIAATQAAGAQEALWAQAHVAKTARKQQAMSIA